MTDAVPSPPDRTQPGPSRPQVDVFNEGISGVALGYGPPVVAPYPLDLETLAREAHDTHVHTVKVKQRDEVERTPCDESDDNESVASWAGLAGVDTDDGRLPTPAVQHERPQKRDRANMRRARKRKGKQPDTANTNGEGAGPRSRHPVRIGERRRRCSNSVRCIANFASCE